MTPKTLQGGFDAERFKNALANLLSTLGGDSSSYIMPKNDAAAAHTSPSYPSTNNMTNGIPSGTANNSNKRNFQYSSTTHCKTAPIKGKVRMICRKIVKKKVHPLNPSVARRTIHPKLIKKAEPSAPIHPKDSICFPSGSPIVKLYLKDLEPISQDEYEGVPEDVCYRVSDLHNAGIIT
jgi:hypothetical protein